MNCIFCKIVNGEIPCYKVYEDDIILAFLDISQATKGHTLIVPKKHYANMLECDEETVMHIYKIANRLGNHLVNVLGAAGMNVLTNVNEVAGQVVKHFHVHLLPRYENDKGVEIEFKNSNPTKLHLEELVNLLK